MSHEWYNVKGIPESWWSTDTESTSAESKLHSRNSKTTSVFGEVERKSLCGEYGVRRSDKYDGVLEVRILCVRVGGKFESYAPFHREPMKLFKNVYAGCGRR